MLPLPLRRLVLAVVISCLALPIYSVQAQDQVSPEKRIQHGWLDPNVAEVYKKWLSEEVVFIITDEERVEFKKLATNQQRDAFVVAFWERRNPSPGAPENKFKEEHYRRIAYANTHFVAVPAGRLTEVTSISRGARQIRSNTISAPNQSRSRRMAARIRHMHMKFGTTNIWRGPVTTYL